MAAYALSPIDLIPDFVPVLGYVDDLIIVPAGIALVIRLIPPDIMAEHREMAIAAQDRPVSRAAAAAICSDLGCGHRPHRLDGDTLFDVTNIRSPLLHFMQKKSHHPNCLR